MVFRCYGGRLIEFVYRLLSFISLPHLDLDLDLDLDFLRLQASFVYAGLSHQIRAYFLNWTVTALMRYENLEYHKV